VSDWLRPRPSAPRTTVPPQTNSACSFASAARKVSVSLFSVWAISATFIEKPVANISGSAMSAPFGSFAAATSERTLSWFAALFSQTMSSCTPATYMAIPSRWP